MTTEEIDKHAIEVMEPYYNKIALASAYANGAKWAQSKVKQELISKAILWFENNIGSYTNIDTSSLIFEFRKEIDRE